MGKNIVAIVQARMGASRLPGKVMLSLHGMPILKWVFQRTQKTKSINGTIFAIPDNKDNDSLNEYLNQIGARVYRGSEDDLVRRFYMTAKYVNATHVVRICADNPFVSGAEVDRLVQFYLESNCDYAYNHIPKNNRYPNGIGAEIVSFQVLQNINEEAPGASAFTLPWGYQSGAMFNNLVIFQQYCQKYGKSHDGLAPLCLNLRRNGLMTPWGYYAMHEPHQLTMEDYMNGRLIEEPLVIFDCDGVLVAPEAICNGVLAEASATVNPN